MGSITESRVLLAPPHDLPGNERLDFLFEFKYVRRKQLGKKGEELKTMDEDALRELTPVRKAFEEALDYGRDYSQRPTAVAELDKLSPPGAP